MSETMQLRYGRESDAMRECREGYIRDRMAERGRRQQATRRYMHRGAEYELVGYGKMHADHWYTVGSVIDNMTGQGPLVSLNMHDVAIYRSVGDGALWARPREEFEDGRFEALPTPSPQ